MDRYIITKAIIKEGGIRRDTKFIPVFNLEVREEDGDIIYEDDLGNTYDYADTYDVVYDLLEKKIVPNWKIVRVSSSPAGKKLEDFRPGTKVVRESKVNFGEYVIDTIKEVVKDTTYLESSHFSDKEKYDYLLKEYKDNILEVIDNECEPGVESSLIKLEYYKPTYIFESGYSTIWDYEFKKLAEE